MGQQLKFKLGTIQDFYPNFTWEALDVLFNTHIDGLIANKKKDEVFAFINTNEYTKIYSTNSGWILEGEGQFICMEEHYKYKYIGSNWKDSYTRRYYERAI